MSNYSIYSDYSGYSLKMIGLQKEFSHSEKARARTILHKALKENKIKKPKKCSECGKPQDKKTIVAHHPDYNKPLKIIWLCKHCHGNKHSKPESSMTTIAISQKNKSGLDQLGKKGDTYDEIISNLLEANFV